MGTQSGERRLKVSGSASSRCLRKSSSGCTTGSQRGNPPGVASSRSGGRQGAASADGAGWAIALVRALASLAARPPDQEAEPRQGNPHPPPRRPPQPKPASGRRAPHPRRNRRADPALSIEPTHRGGTATTSTGISQMAPPISPKTGALITFKDTPKSRRSETTLRPSPPPRAYIARRPKPGYFLPMPNLNDANPSCDAELKRRSTPAAIRPPLHRDRAALMRTAGEA